MKKNIEGKINIKTNTFYEIIERANFNGKGIFVFPTIGIWNKNIILIFEKGVYVLPCLTLNERECLEHENRMSLL